MIPPAVAREIELAAPNVLDELPDSVRRAAPPALPEIAQPEVFRHFLRLSQETLGAAVGVDIGQGTATMKFSPPAHEALVQASGLVDLHPLADDRDLQGLLGIVHRFEQMLCEISGMAGFSFQPGGGTHGIYANACIMRAYHAERGEDRDEILTTVYSHPADAAAPATAGYRVVTIYPGEQGYIELDAVRAAVSERTAGLMIANPEDTGIFNPHIEEIVSAVHDAGGLCAYDWANANGLIGIVRAADAGFDLCQLNLHKTFASPHASGGLACGAIGVSPSLVPFLPSPRVSRSAAGYRLDHDCPRAIGTVRAFHGVIGTVLRSYAWVASLGADGLRRVAESAVLNNNYLAHRLGELGAFEPAYAGANRAPAPRTDPLQPRHARGGDRCHHGRCREAQRRPWRDRFLLEPPPVAHPRAGDAGTDRDADPGRPRRVCGNHGDGRGRGARAPGPCAQGAGALRDPPRRRRSSR
jgi:glycine dehydrogenase subunit 2